jgi:hypothetical protein
MSENASITAIIAEPSFTRIWNSEGVSIYMKKVYRANTVTIKPPEVGNSSPLVRLAARGT